MAGAISSSRGLYSIAENSGTYTVAFTSIKIVDWKEWLECRKCGCTYNVNESVYFATNYPRYKNKNIEKFGPSSFIGLSNRDVNWDKLKKEGFNRNEIPEKIP